MAQTLSYKQWQAAITPEQIFSATITFSDVKVDASTNATYWLEGRPFDKGRYVIVRKTAAGEEDLTPKQYNVRTKVHEYGGAPYTIKGNVLCFANYADQVLYKQDLTTGRIVPLTPAKNKDGSQGRYTAMQISPSGNEVIFVYEKVYGPERETENYLAMRSLTDRSMAEPIILASGHDFYGDPIFSNDGKHIAWAAWNHPNMPWDATCLFAAEWHGMKLMPQEIKGSKGACFCFPRWSPFGELIFAMDEPNKQEDDPKNWWNLYAWDPEGNGKIKSITQEHAEYGEPAWRFGGSPYDVLGDGTIIATQVCKGKESVVLIDPETRKVKKMMLPYNDIAGIVAAGKEEAIIIAAGESEGYALAKIHTKTGAWHIIKKSSSITMNTADVAVPQQIAYPTGKGGKEQSYAYLYLPKHAGYHAPSGEKPPLIVMAHGGPTSRTTSSFSLVRQFWTSQGYAIVDVDYRGSTGYGRTYRDSLRGKWGLYDAEDVANAVRFLIKGGVIDPHAVFIRGGSAGGYVVQRVLTEFPELFAAGASYFGIGNVITLIKESYLYHKFESRYCEYLIGPPLKNGDEIYKERSPKFHIDKLKAPMILLQGADDKIVTPANSIEMAEILKKKGIPCEYYEYAGEGHGFRSKEANVDSLLKEAGFYRRVMGE